MQEIIFEIIVDKGTSRKTIPISLKSLYERVLNSDSIPPEVKNQILIELNLADIALRGEVDGLSEAYNGTPEQIALQFAKGVAGIMSEKLGLRILPTLQELRKTPIDRERVA